MISKEIIISNKNGLHARPAALFVKAAGKFKSDVLVSKDGFEVNGKSIMGVMTLAAETGSMIRITADGADEKEALETLEKLVTGGFYEED